MLTMLIHCIVGARPNFVKIAPLMKAFAGTSSLRARLIHTGQHYDAEMSRHFFEDLEIPSPDRHLEVGSGSHAVQTARIMERYEAVLLEERPDLILVVGDVNSTAACALVGAKCGVKIAHVEAGLRSFDRTMPEEINRIVTDALSDFHFITSPEAREHLLREGIGAEQIHFVGNVMIDTLLESLPLAAEKQSAAQLGLAKKRYAVATIHRPSNVDTAAGLEQVLTIFAAIGRELPIVFPLHPRTEQRAEDLGLIERLRACPGLHLTSPYRYLEFIDLLRTARLVLTDSGGVQEETTVLGIPCLTMRPNTERPITIQSGTNRLVGSAPERVIEAAQEILRGRISAPTCPPQGWDGHAAERIARILAEVAASS